MARDPKGMRDAKAVRAGRLQRIGETKSRLTRLGSGAVRDALEDDLRSTIKTRERLEAEVARLIAADAEGRTGPGSCALPPAWAVSSWPGFQALRPSSAHSPADVASLAGVAPHPCRSDTARRSGRCEGGRLRPRCTLQMAAPTLTSQRFRDAPLHKCDRRLRENGKPFDGAIVAVMRKLLLALDAMVKNDTTSVREQDGRHSCRGGA